LHFRYYLSVKYVLENDKLSVEDLFNRYIDNTSVEAKVFAKLSQIQ